MSEYYEGFSFLEGLSLTPAFVSRAEQLFRHLRLTPGHDLKMLDVGGGSGLFSKAFEQLGYGTSTYVDLDPQSCSFAREGLGLDRVFNCDATELRYLNASFDFIYSRHLIEHLLDPVRFVQAMFDLLRHPGLFVLQCPNGDSLEYLAYPTSTLRKRFQAIRAASHFSRRKILWISLTRGMLHGIDPPRHLWAITPRGLLTWARGMGLECEVRTYPLWNAAYSPYYDPGTLAERVQASVGRYLLSPILGGTHLVATFRTAAR